MGYPFADVKFPRTGREFLRPSKLEIRSAEFGHEIAIITVAQSSAYYPDFLTGAPVYIRYGTAEAAETFVGYVDHVRPDTTQPSSLAPARTKTIQLSRIVCVGATFPMKGAHQRVFRSVTADSVFQQIATSHGLASDAEPHNRRWPMLAQAGTSDWAFLAKTAHSIGYTLLAERTTVRMVPPTRDLQSIAPQTLVFDVHGIARVGGLFTQPQMTHFAPVLGEAVPGDKGVGRARRVVHALDLRTRTVTQVVDETAAHAVLGTQAPGPVFTHYPTIVGQDTSDHGDALLSMREDNRWHITASASVAGDARVRAGRMIYTRNLPGNYSGYWYVRAAKHMFAWNQMTPQLPGTYTVELNLGRDGTGTSVGAPSTYPQRVLTDPVPSGIASRLDANGVWKSASATPDAPASPDVSRPAYVDQRLARR